VLFALAGLCVGLELFALTGFGIHAAGAAVSALLAGLSVSGPPELHPVLAAPAAVAFGVGTFAAALTSWRRRRDLPFDTTPRLVGRGAILLAHPHPESQSEPVAVVGGQVWRISAVGAELPDGQFVRVVGVRDDRLVVRAVPATRGL
jgi:membrane protein implicated in regulation of membrane protease activity